MLAEILHKIAAEGQSTRDPYRKRPSLAGPERCIRSLVYHARGELQRPLPGRAVFVFDDSSWHAELTKDWIRKTAYRLHSEEMEVETPVGKGRIDGILTDLLSQDILWEHKAINHFSFDRIWKGQWPLDYLTQKALYLNGVQRVNPDISRGLLLVKNKNTAQYLEILSVYDGPHDTLTVLEMVRSDGQRTDKSIQIENICTEAVKKFAQVEAHRVGNTLPDRPFPAGTEYPCGYCAWADTCWEGYEDEFDLLAQDVQLDQELATTCGYLQEVKMHIAEMEKEESRLREIVRDYMTTHGYRQGRAGEYAVSRELRHRTSWDESVIPPHIIDVAKQSKPYEVLTIRKPKPKGVKDASQSTD